MTLTARGDVATNTLTSLREICAGADLPAVLKLLRDQAAVMQRDAALDLLKRLVPEGGVEVWFDYEPEGNAIDFIVGVGDVSVRCESDITDLVDSCEMEAVEAAETLGLEGVAMQGDEAEDDALERWADSESAAKLREFLRLLMLYAEGCHEADGTLLSGASLLTADGLDHVDTPSS